MTKKHCYICTNKTKIDWKNEELLRSFMSSDNKILSPKATGTCAKHQRQVAKAIKRARVMGIVPPATTIEE